MLKLLFQETKLPFYYTHMKFNRYASYKNIFPPKPVMVLPGMGTGDITTSSLRKFLRHTGLIPYGWDLGVNKGDISVVLPQLIERVSSISNESQPVTLIGWSLGGVYSREIARRIPEHVRAVCCLGSPIANGPKGGPISHTILRYRLNAMFYRLIGFNIDVLSKESAKRERVPLQVPSHVIYSKKDGILDWNACVDNYNSHTTHTEVKAPHFSMGFSKKVFEEIGRWLEEVYELEN